MDKLVVKTAVKAVLIILGALLIIFAIFNLAFPQHMASLWESTGNYSVAVKYADLRYSYTKDGNDLARCFDDSVLWGDEKSIIEYGNELVVHDDFLEVCESKDAVYTDNLYGAIKYRDRVYSEIAGAYYRRGDDGDLLKAVTVAAESNGSTSFGYGNALMSLASKINKNKDADGAELMLYALNGNVQYGFTAVNPTDAKEIENLGIVKDAMQAIVDAAPSA